MLVTVITAFGQRLFFTRPQINDFLVDGAIPICRYFILGWKAMLYDGKVFACQGGNGAAVIYYSTGDNVIHYYNPTNQTEKRAVVTLPVGEKVIQLKHAYFPGTTAIDPLNKFIVLDVPHISIYSLIIEPNTKFYLNKVREQDEDKSREFYDFIIDFLLNHSYEHYEISNFAKNGYYSKHNLTYWKNKEYIGIGASASGYEKNIRYKNSSSISKYNNRIREREEEIITKDLLYEYYLITNLRLIIGFSINEINQIFKFNFLKLKNEAIKKLLKSNLIKIEGDNFACTRDGLALQDFVVRTLI